MLQLATSTTNKLAEILSSSTGVPAAVAAISSRQGLALAAVTPHQVISHNIAPDISERSTSSKYPLIYVYCAKLVNELREKFRAFSGEAEMVIEARVSQDRLERIDSNLHAYVDAITGVLDDHRGNWGDGMFYGGGYEVTFGGIKQGGRNFIQIAKVTFVVEISTD